MAITPRLPPADRNAGDQCARQDVDPRHRSACAASGARRLAVATQAPRQRIVAEQISMPAVRLAGCATRAPAQSSGDASARTKPAQAVQMLGRPVALCWSKPYSGAHVSARIPHRAQSWRGWMRPRCGAWHHRQRRRVGSCSRGTGCRRPEASGSMLQPCHRAPHGEQGRLQDVERVDLLDAALATANANARSRICPASSSRRSGVSSFESASPRICRPGSRITAAANTGPAADRGPLRRRRR